MANRRISWYDADGNIKFVQSCEQGLEAISKPANGLNWILGEPEILSGSKVVDNSIVNGATNNLTTLQELRLIRDSMLKNCDWTVGVDTPLAESKKAQWVTYRQQLRDLPSNYTDSDNIDDVVFPTQPT